MQKDYPDYDNEDTLHWIEKYPDEDPNFDTWDSIAIASLDAGNEKLFPS